jgi:hypothetical protein
VELADLHWPASEERESGRAGERESGRAGERESGRAEDRDNGRATITARTHLARAVDSRLPRVLGTALEHLVLEATRKHNYTLLAGILLQEHLALGIAPRHAHRPDGRERREQRERAAKPHTQHANFVVRGKFRCGARACSPSVPRA